MTTENLRKQAAVFLSHSSAQTTVKQEVTKMSESDFWSHTYVCYESCLGSKKKEWQKIKNYTGKILFYFPAYLLYHCPPTSSF